VSDIGTDRDGAEPWSPSWVPPLGACPAEALEEERATLERVEYLAGERRELFDPAAWIPLTGGPADGEECLPARCGCVDCARGARHPSWPVRFATQGGEYVLNFVFIPDDEDEPA
jgi:hypothetical protein